MRGDTMFRFLFLKVERSTDLANESLKFRVRELLFQVIGKLMDAITSLG